MAERLDLRLGELDVRGIEPRRVDRERRPATPDRVVADVAARTLWPAPGDPPLRAAKADALRRAVGKIGAVPKLGRGASPLQRFGDRRGMDVARLGEDQDFARHRAPSASAGRWFLGISENGIRERSAEAYGYRRSASDGLARRRRRRWSNRDGR